MKVIKDCWRYIFPAECAYGAHIFENSTVKIYVPDGLGVDLEMAKLFCKKRDFQFVGHCIFVFKNVHRFDFSVSPYEVKNGKTIWRKSIQSHYQGEVLKELNNFSFAGHLQGLQAYVDAEVEAQHFELHILEKDESA